MSNAKISIGRIGPITVDQLNPGALRIVAPAIPRPPGVTRVPELDPVHPGRVTAGTLDHAHEVAERVIATMGELPHDQRAGDLLAMAFAIRHYHGGGSR